MPRSDDTTALLHAVRGGDREAFNRLMPLVYQELRRIAHRELGRRGRDGSLQTTALVHEAYLKLVDQTRVEVDDRAHFLALAATAMRHLVIDAARARMRKKRGGGWKRVTWDEAHLASDDRIEEVLEVHAALERLDAYDPRLSKVVECRFFAGLTVQETATALALSPRTVDRAWDKAKAWLYREIHET